MKTKDLMFLGAGVLAGVVIAKMASKRSSEKKSNIGGYNLFDSMATGKSCTCADGFTGWCASGNCASCCEKLGGAKQTLSRR